MARQLIRTGVITETNATHYLTIKIVDTNKNDFVSGDDELLKEITSREEKLKVLCMLINHSSINFCSRHYMTGTLKEILSKIKKLSQEEYNLAYEKYRDLNPYNPYAPYKILEKLHPDIEQFIDNSPNREIYHNIKMGLSVFDARDKILKVYASLTNQSFEEVKKQFLKCLGCDNCFDCCKMFNMEHTEDLNDCQCGYFSFRTLITNLGKFDCFKDTESFATRFLSNELKIVGLKRKIPEDNNLWQYII